MKIEETRLPGVLLIEPAVFGDARGFFMETWQEERYAAVGLPRSWRQDNLSCSQRGVLRGLHGQNPSPQGKLVYVLQGEVFDVAVDIRRGSPTFGCWTAVYLSAENKKQFYLPPGMAHGFLVMSETALFAYKCTELYAPEHEFSVAWDDPDIGIDWPLTGGPPQLSGKDANAPRLRDIMPERLVAYG
ncbi:MAG: dTDP-4-dehydrorhamnose 3,5-epimerase [Negativicutes bacterium]|nr:dTDP-4-dehydrorhamnose 3,5-epimerase [Negativicutes bacterium]